jgi:hypothetical protein
VGDQTELGSSGQCSHCSATAVCGGQSLLRELIRLVVRNLGQHDRLQKLVNIRVRFCLLEQLPPYLALCRLN